MIKRVDTLVPVFASDWFVCGIGRGHKADPHANARQRKCSGFADGAATDDADVRMKGHVADYIRRLSIGSSALLAMRRLNVLLYSLALAW